MDPDDIGELNVGVLEEVVGDLTACRNVLKEGIRATSHLVRAVSVARAVGRCPFEARLIEVMGASDYAASASLFPGKGIAVHQVLALAVPRLFSDFVAQREFGKALGAVEEYVRGALEELREGKVPPVADEAGTTREDSVVRSAGLMASKFVELMKALDGKRIDVGRARVRAELELFDYKLHVRGVVDLLVEEPGREGRGVVVEWKTSRGEEKGEAPSPDEVAQAYLYSVMAAHRLGYTNGVDAVLNCAVFPVIIRDRGRTNPYSVSRCYKTARREVDEGALLHDIKLAATHLLLNLLDLKKVDKSWDVDKERRICGRDGKTVYRRVPERLLNRGYQLNPRFNKGFPCSSCRLREACLFYLFSKLEQDEVHRIAWRARRSVFRVRENALLPYYSLAKYGGVGGFVRLEGGSRADLFERLEVSEGGLKAVLYRRVRDEERQRGLPLTVREGKPVSVFLKDVDELIYSSNFSGNVERVEVSGDELSVTVSFEGRFTRLAYFLLRDLLERERSLAIGVVAVEGNVDLTHIELMSIDAFQRATKLLVEEGGLPEDEAKQVAFEAGYKPKRWLYSLFSIRVRGDAVR